MFRLYDTRLRAATEIQPARRGQLRMYSCGPTVYRSAQAGALRAYLLPDLIRRNAERHGLSVVVCQPITDVGYLEGDNDGIDLDAFHADCAALNLLPPDFEPRDAESTQQVIEFLGNVIDIHTGDISRRSPHHEDDRAQSNSVTDRDAARHWVHSEPVLFEGATRAGSTGNVVLLADLADRGLDPLAARLAFLEHPYRQQLNLTWDTLTAADGTLRGWRELVADWADEPSRPMCADYWTRVSDALDEDLDTPAVLRTLRELAADPGIPAGSKFETFASADRVLGLDLVRLIGRPRPSARATDPHISGC